MSTFSETLWAIEGNGFFPIQDPATNQTLYTRAGNFSLNADGQTAWDLTRGLDFVSGASPYP